jgi:hypothetical protein
MKNGDQIYAYVRQHRGTAAGAIRNGQPKSDVDTMGPLSIWEGFDIA